jgi:hypothetical protein
MNFRRGSDVSEDGESSGVARLCFAWLDFESPSQIEGVKRKGRLQRLNRRGGTLGSGRGVYITQRGLSVVLTWARYYRGYEKIETVRSYWYYRPHVGSTRGAVVPALRRFNREKLEFHQ